MSKFFGFVSVAALATGLTAAPATFGGVVSVNFYDSSTTTAMATSEVAGVVPVDHWNNFSQDTVAAANALSTVDNTGTGVGVKVSWPTNGVGGVYHGTSTVADTAGNDRMMRSGLYASPTVRVGANATFAAAGYSVILYADPLGTTKQETKVVLTDYSANTTTTIYIDDVGTDFNGTFVAADGATHIGNITQGANYYKFTGLHSQSLQFTISSPNTAPYRTMIPGLQVVPDSFVAPEPTSIAILAGLGGLSLLRRKRRGS